MGTIAIKDGLQNGSGLSNNFYLKKTGCTHNVVRWPSSRSRADRLLMTNEEERTRPPRTFENSPRLSRTRLMAEFHSPAPGLIVGSTSGLGSRCNRMKSLSKGALGMYRTRAPRGIETTPRASEMPHSRPPMRVTWKAAPPTKTMRIWTAISAWRVSEVNQKTTRSAYRLKL